ncbi:MAG: ATP-dependent RecD-like DNA helicase [Legionellaceae bacterium]
MVYTRPMAIYHFNSKIITRSKGQNAVAAAAYRHANKLLDETTGITHNYSNKGDVVYSEILLPDLSPEWLQEMIYGENISITKATENLWNAVEKVEKRVDAQLAREVEFSLPIELDVDQNKMLVREFVQSTFVNKGMIADWSIHWDKGNPHVHVMLSMREILQEGFGKKVREWNKKECILEWRREWAEIANYHLAKHQFDVRIDHRSYKDLGIDLVPTIHQGKKITQMEMAGIPTERRQAFHDIHKTNLAKIAKNPSVVFDKLSISSSTFTQEQIAHEVGRFANDKGQYHPVFDVETFDVEDTVLSEGEEKNILTTHDIATLFSTIEAKEGVFTERQLSAQLLPFTDNAEALVKALLQVKQSPEIISLGAGDDGKERFTTRSFFEVENKLQAIVDKLKQSKTHSIKPSKIKKYLQKINVLLPSDRQLSDEQQKAILHITQGSDISIVVGRAGTGKSTSLNAANEIWKNEGFRVHGIALAGIAAEGLEKGSGIQSRTIESFKLALDSGRLSLSKNDVVVLDEAGMVDSESMLSIVEKVNASCAKFVLVGDAEQLQPIGPGAAFRALAERVGFAELTRIYRQTVDWQIDASSLLAKGNTKEALALYDTHQRLHFAEKAIDAMTQLVHQWYNDFSQERISTLILAHRNQDVVTLNQLARQHLLSEGILDAGFGIKTSQGIKDFSQGERLLFLKNDTRLGVKNGTLGTITAITQLDDACFVSVRLDAPKGEEGKIVTIDVSSYNHFTHGYALSVHKSQGATVDKTYVYAGGNSWFKNLVYVALTRHRLDAHIYADKETYTNKNTLFRAFMRYAEKDSVLDFPYAFGLRRNIPEESLLGRFKAHILKGWHLINPLAKAIYHEKVHALHEEAIVQNRRFDAGRVVEYVEANKAVGKSFEALQHQLFALGIERIDYRTPEFDVLASTTAYRDYQAFIAKRDSVAHTLNVDISRYEIALERHLVDIDKLVSQSERHLNRQTVLAYKKAFEEGRVVVRDKVASQLLQNTKAYFPYLRQAGVFVSDVYQHAKGHDRRQLLSQLSPQERQDFYRVEQYWKQHIAVGKQYKVLTEAKQKGFNTAYFENKLKTLINERDAIASFITHNIESYKAGLDFYGIGLSSSTSIGPERQAKAQERWYALKSHAARHDARDNVIQYLKAKKENNLKLQLHLAHLILEEPKVDHSLIIEQTSADVVKDVWRTIRHDANEYKKACFVETLTPEEKQHFALVDAYAVAQKEARVKWRDAFNSPNREHYTDEAKKVLFVAANDASEKADEYASRILMNAPLCQTSLAFFNIAVADIEKQASIHACRERVNQYQLLLINPQKSTVMARAALAKAIANNGRQHHRHLLDAGIDWKTVYRDVKPIEQQALFASLLPEEKQLLRLAKQYRKINKRFGKTVGQFKNKTVAQENVNRLGAKRDKYAHTLKEKLALRDFIRLYQGMENETVLDKLLAFDETKLAQQAQRHETRVTQAADWISINHDSLSHLNGVLQTHDDNSHFFALTDWLLGQEEYADLRKSIERQFERFHYAFMENGLTAVEANRLQKAFHSAKANVTHIETMSYGRLEKETEYTLGERIKIQKAQRLEKESRSITGTIAERYLREHRAITGTIPESFRYHPGLYHFETGKKYPALLVIAKNEKGMTQAVQAIYLEPAAAHKAKELTSAKLTYGLLSKGRLGVLVNQGKDNQTIALAEGPETALSVAHAKPEMTIYATLGCANFKRVPITQETHTVLFCADNDGIKNNTIDKTPSQRQLETAAKQLAKQGISVYQTMHQNHKDFNDVLKQEGIVAVQSLLEKTVLVKESKTAEKTISALRKEINAVIPTQNKEPRKPEWDEILVESVPIKDTLAEHYLKVHCGFDNLPEKRLHYHPGLWERETNTYMPALIGEFIGNNHELKGIQVHFIDEKTAEKANLDIPVRYAGYESGCVTPIHQGNLSNDRRLLIAFDLESSLALAKSIPSATVFCARSLESLLEFPFEGSNLDIILCQDKKWDAEVIHTVIDSLSEKGFGVSVAQYEKSIYALFKEKNEKVINEELGKAKKYQAKLKIDPMVIEAIHTWESLTEAHNKAMKIQSYEHIFTKQKLTEFAKLIEKDKNLYQKIQRYKPDVAAKIKQVFSRKLSRR